MSDCNVSAARLDAYADGDAGPAETYAMEIHLLSCELCQSWLAPRAPALGLEQVWDGIEQRLDPPGRT